MKVDRIYISVYRYDKEVAKTAIASIRYWYPDIPVFLIKDYGKGSCDTSDIQKFFNVAELDLARKDLGWGYGKLEPLFLEQKHSFLVLDADTVFTGPVLDKVKDIETDFIVDDEIPELNRFNQIYYNLDKINNIAPDFAFHGYSFNSGQWFGTSTILKRSDFELSLEWSHPPKSKYPDIVFEGDQAHLNFHFHRLENAKRLTIKRISLMIYPVEKNADFILLEDIINKRSKTPFIIHWAGMKYDNKSKLPRQDIIDYYNEYYYSIVGRSRRPKDKALKQYLVYEKKLKHFLNK